MNHDLAYHAPIDSLDQPFSFATARQYECHGSTWAEDLLICGSVALICGAPLAFIVWRLFA